MRVLHINVNYIVSALHQTLVDHLAQLGVESKVFVPTYDKSRSIVECKDYVTLSECFKKWDRLFYFKKQRKIISSLLSSYNVSDFDCIHAHTLFTDGNAAMELSEKYGIPYVAAIRNTDVNDFFKRMIHLRNRGVKILKKASVVFFLSPAYKDAVLSKYVPPTLRDEIDRKSFIVPNGIDDFWLEQPCARDATAIQKRILSEKRLKCLYVGGVDRNKNVELALKALSFLNAEGWECNLNSVGKIVDKNVYERLETYSCFEHTPPKRMEDLIEYYRNADLFVMASHTETFGLVYAEAMSQGLPVVYTRGQGFDRQFPDGLVGFPVSDVDPQETVSAIKRIAENYSKISEAARDNVGKFNWNDIAREYVKIYATLPKKKNASRSVS